VGWRPCSSRGASIVAAPSPAPVPLTRADLPLPEGGGDHTPHSAATGMPGLASSRRCSPRNNKSNANFIRLYSRRRIAMRSRSGAHRIP
jgi:hypothetical protein